MPWVDEERLEGSFRQMSARVRELAREPRTLVRATLWAAANWLLDAGSLYVFVGAFGHWVNPDGLLVAYGLANVLAALPITPGGLGVVETILTSALVGFDTARGVALLGVLAYRLVNFWLPIPVGGLCYLSLQVRPGTAGADARRKVAQDRREALHRFMEVVVPPESEDIPSTPDGADISGGTEPVAAGPDDGLDDTDLVVIENPSVELPAPIHGGGSAA